ncbi:hypothetical protein HDU84_006527 [Entophlyctis sp. JEL0112]|nr:hypothetical protein HDU84_006527 [Entophlyctis sp. JEL0112]
MASSDPNNQLPSFRHLVAIATSPTQPALQYRRHDQQHHQQLQHQQHPPLSSAYQQIYQQSPAQVVYPFPAGGHSAAALVQPAVTATTLRPYLHPSVGVDGAAGTGGISGEKLLDAFVVGNGPSPGPDSKTGFNTVPRVVDGDATVFVPQDFFQTRSDSSYNRAHRSHSDSGNSGLSDASSGAGDGASDGVADGRDRGVGNSSSNSNNPTVGKSVCSMCPAAYTTSSRLKIHIRTHTNESPYTCPHAACGKNFKSNSNLAQHMRVHMSKAERDAFDRSNRRTVACRVCGNLYKTEKSMDQHFWREHAPRKGRGAMPPPALDALSSAAAEAAAAEADGAAAGSAAVQALFHVDKEKSGAVE